MRFKLLEDNESVYLAIIEQLGIHMNDDVVLFGASNGRFRYFDYNHHPKYKLIRLGIGLPTHRINVGGTFNRNDVLFDISVVESLTIDQLVKPWEDEGGYKGIESWNNLVSKDYNIKSLINKL